MKDHGEVVFNIFFFFLEPIPFPQNLNPQGTLTVPRSIDGNDPFSVSAALGLLPGACTLPLL